jgi:tetratricopeptide (TPR) repeat protein
MRSKRSANAPGIGWFPVFALILAIIVSLSGCGDRYDKKSLSYLSDEVKALTLQGRWAEAAEISEYIARQAAEVMGTESPEYAAALPRIAICYGGLDRWQEADSLFALSAKILTQYQECDSMRARVLYERAAVWMIWKNYAFAESLLVKSLSLSRAVCDVRSPIVLNAYKRLVDCQFALGDFNGAASTFLGACKVLCGYELAPDSNCLYAIGGLAGCYLQLRRYATVDSLVQSTLDMCPQAESVSTSLTADMTLSLAVARYRMQKWEAAGDAFLRALQLAENAYGQESPALLNYLRNAAINLTKLERHDEALLLRKRVLAITERKYGSTDTLLIPILEGIAKELRSLNRESEAQEIDSRAKAIASPSK